MIKMNEHVSIYEIIGRYVIAKKEGRDHMEEHEDCPNNCFVMRAIMGRLNALERIIRDNNDGAIPDV